MRLNLSDLEKVDYTVYSDVRTVLERVQERGTIDVLFGKRFLISGGAGFIGSWLVDALYALGAEKITIIDNLSTGSPDNIKHLLNKKNVEIINKPVETLKPLKGYDYVIHLAARPNPDDYVKHPVETLLVSSRGTEVMLESARLSDAIFLLASTSEVYGHAEVIPTPEDYWGYVNPVGPRSCYDEGKRFAEALSNAYLRQYRLDVRISRIFNTYGSRLDWHNPGYGRVIVRFITQALRGEPITIYGDGKQTRSFLYVSDNIEAHLLLLEPRKDLKGIIINIGSEQEISILELAKLILKITKSDSKLVFYPPRPDDPLRRRPDITKAKKLLGWRQHISLEEGLKRTIEWIRRRLIKYS